MGSTPTAATGRWRNWKRVAFARRGLWVRVPRGPPGGYGVGHEAPLSRVLPKLPGCPDSPEGVKLMFQKIKGCGLHVHVGSWDLFIGFPRPLSLTLFRLHRISTNGYQASMVWHMG